MQQDKRRAVVTATGSTLAVLLAMVLAVSGWTSAQAQSLQPASPSVGRAITVVGTGTISVEPDIARAHIGVEAVNESVRVASDEAQTAMDELLAALAEQGIDERDLQTSGFSVYSERGMDRDPEAVRYRVSNQVHVTIRDLDSVGEVLDAAIDAGANQIYGIQFDLENPADHAGEARRAAVAHARASAEELAELNDVGLGAVLHITEIIGQPGIPYAGVEMAMADGMGGGTPIVPGEYEISLRIQVTYALTDQGAQAGEPSAPQPLPAPDEPVEPDQDDEAEQENGASETAAEPEIEQPEQPQAMPATAPMGTTVSAVSSFAEGSVASVVIEGGDEESLRRFLQTSLQPIFPGYGMTAITITIAALPSDLPFELELPEDLEVAGGTVRTGDYDMTDITLVGPAPVDQWVGAVNEQLREQGYRPAPLHGAQQGEVFQSAQQVADALLCSPDNTIGVNVMAGEANDQGIVRLILNPQYPGGGGMCDPGQAQGYAPAPWLPEGLLPTLQAPQGVAIYSMGTGGSDRDFEANARVQSPELNAQDLYEVWEPVLTEAGWTLEEVESSEHIVWSHWTREMNGTTWNNVFYILRNAAGTDNYMASLRLERGR